MQETAVDKDPQPSHSQSSGRAAQPVHGLGDFTISPRVLPITGLAMVIGMLASLAALGLLRLIGLFSNLFFFQRVRFDLVTPAGNHLGWLAALVPVGGGLVVGLMARYGSERIRGHGIPEAIEAILIHGSKVDAKVAVLKPVSAAVSIGSGGPFGAEGPIILTGGALGSLVAQLFRMTAAERKTLLVAGAAAGMSATFASPVSAALLAVELLLFEWKPRSFIPVAMASITAGAARRYMIGMEPLFPVPAHPAFIGPEGLLSCMLVGLAAGALSGLLTLMVYTAEDSFGKLPIHWMWWPAIGGLVIAAGGLVFPQALGVGYDVIGNLLQADAGLRVLAGVLLVKSIIWAVALGSGTSGGVLAPLLMMGAALGGLESTFLPNEGAGFWPLVSMSAILGGTMRVPFTAVVFAIELTHDVNMILPLLVAATVAYAFTALVLKRSILTEKVARRGYHLSREYATDPLEILFVREVMRTNVLALPASLALSDLDGSARSGAPRGQRLYPVVDDGGALTGVLTRSDIESYTDGDRHPNGTGNSSGDVAVRLGDLDRPEVVVAYPDEPLRTVLFRMAETNLTSFPVVERGPGRELVGMIALTDMLKAHQRHLEEEERREVVRGVRLRSVLRGRRPTRTGTPTAN
ncbi:MAG: chloride channel protein [Chloroflexi bacterium]|nr:chloride channel protein [Chloroflexota bacterium]